MRSNEQKDEGLKDVSARAADAARGAALRQCRRASARVNDTCWRCESKRGALRRGRVSHAFRTICTHCAAWRVLNAEQRRAQGHAAFVPASKRTDKAGAPKVKKAGGRVAQRTQRRPSQVRNRARREPDEALEPTEITPVGDEAYASDPNADPLRDYTYWLQQEQGSKKGKG